ncbi:MAG: signal recognition particle-docking protein FtsY [SAR202 cluster bacterium]|nr:signal recognition particle-docking protein FtsY [SAR202 cluster bacterium]
MLRLFRKSRPEKTAQAVTKTRDTWFSRVKSLFQGSPLNDDLWEQLEELLISADVGVRTTQKLLTTLQVRVKAEKLSTSEQVLKALKQEMSKILASPEPTSDNGTVTPEVLLMVGVNGSGKTTSIAKLANLYKESGKKVVLGAGDTFRAAAIDQLQIWGSRTGIDVIAHQQGADPGAVAFDSLQAAKSRHADVVIIDTAGRLHNKANLMEEIKKVQRVLTRQEAGTQRVLLTLDATTGQNGLQQAKAFTEALKCDGVVLSKLDGTAKGGIVLAIVDELRLPILHIGTGEQLDDIAPFEAGPFVDALFGEQAGR